MRTLIVVLWVVASMAVACGEEPDFHGFVDTDTGDTDDTDDTDTATDDDAGPDASGDSDIDTESDTPTDTEDTESETEDTETEDTETEDTEPTDTDDGCTASGNWYDPDTGLCWQQEPSDAATLSWSDAISYCEDLDLGDSTEWRLPSIDEARSIVRGCPSSETGGSCGVTDECLLGTCWSDSTCPACTAYNGPDDGCYWVELEGSCSMSWYWTSSSQTDNPAYAWELAFNVGGRPGAVDKSTLLAARCVRTAL